MIRRATLGGLPVGPACRAGPSGMVGTFGDSGPRRKQLSSAAQGPFRQKGPTWSPAMPCRGLVLPCLLLSFVVLMSEPLPLLSQTESGSSTTLAGYEHGRNPNQGRSVVIAKHGIV